MGYLEPKIAGMFQRRFLKCSVVLFFIISCSKTTDQLPYYNSPDFDPIFIENRKDLESKIKHTIEDFSFIDTNGKAFGSKGLNKPDCLKLFSTTFDISAPMSSSFMH